MQGCVIRGSGQIWYHFKHSCVSSTAHRIAWNNEQVPGAWRRDMALYSPAHMEQCEGVFFFFFTPSQPGDKLFYYYFNIHYYYYCCCCGCAMINSEGSQTSRLIIIADGWPLTQNPGPSIWRRICSCWPADCWGHFWNPLRWLSLEKRTAWPDKESPPRLCDIWF